MSDYKIVAVLWKDHTFFEGYPLDWKSANDSILPTLSIGLLWKETEESVTLVSDIERNGRHGDSGNFIVIFKGSIEGIQEFGSIKLKKIKAGD